jgi:hypothetical protein
MGMTAQLPAKEHDMGVYGMIRDRVVVALNGRDDLRSGVNPSVALHQEKQDPKLGFRQFQRLAFQKRLACRRIESQSSDPNGVSTFFHDSLPWRYWLQ